LTRDITIQDINGNAIVPGAADKIRAVIGREGETAKLTVTSDAATANGSSFTKGTANRLRLDASDLALMDSGVYSIQIDFYDSHDVAEWKCVSKQVFVLEASL